MRRRILVVLVVLTACIGLLAALGLLSGDREVRAPTGSADRCGTPERRALDAWGRAGFSGTIAVLSDGRFDCLRAYGTADRKAHRPMTLATAFSIGSVSKSVTAAAVLRLEDAGELRRGDRAGDLVRGLRGDARAVTVKQLLLHTSGLPASFADDLAPLDREAAIAAIGDLELEFEPGSDYLYSNAGYGLLALIVDAVADGGFRDYVASEVLTVGGRRIGGFWHGSPAVAGPRAVGYTRTGPSSDRGDFKGPYWALAGSGDVAMNVPDLARWAHELFHGSLLSERAVRAAATSGFEHDEGRTSTAGWEALTEPNSGLPVVGSAGDGGTGQNVIVLASLRTGRIVAAASNTEDVTAEELVQAIGPALLKGEPPRRPRRSRVRLDAGELRAIAGTYRLPGGGTLEVMPRRGGLSVIARDRRGLGLLFPLPDGVDAETVLSHERRVQGVLGGATREGRKERAMLERDIGAIRAVSVLGSIVAANELRTYVRVRTSSGSRTLWYALDDEDGIAAADMTPPPPLEVMPVGAGRFDVDDPTLEASPVKLRFVDDEMMIESAGRSVTAERTGEGR